MSKKAAFFEFSKIFSLLIFCLSTFIGSEAIAKTYSNGETEFFWVQDTYHAANNEDDDGNRPSTYMSFLELVSTVI